MADGTFDFMGKRDARVSEYFLMDNVYPTLFLTVIYLLFVKCVGPWWMRNRKPFEIKTILIVYNLLLVAINIWIVLTFGMNGWFGKYSLRCEPVDFSNDPFALKMMQAMWVFFISKLLEFIDTIFFILRKKDSQITKLHVLHHSSVPLLTWYVTAFGSGGYNTMFPIINAFVHIWMYLYYGLSAMGPTVQKYLWWKKHLTTFQMIQFVWMMVFNVQLYFFHPKDCEVSGFLVAISVLPAVMFLGLFVEFYIKEYKKTPSPTQSNVKVYYNSGSYIAQKYKKKY